MSLREKSMAEDTLNILEKGNYVNSRQEEVQITPALQYAADNTKLYTPDELQQLVSAIALQPAFNTQFEVTNETTLDAARRVGDQANVLALNFASAKNPGGGFLGGAVAQEETVARASALYPCLLRAPEYYNHHREHKSCLYSDHMIYSPAVPVFKYEDGRLMDRPLNLGIITSPAVNAGVVRSNEPGNVDRIEPVMRLRIEKLLALCLAHHHRTIILGAWGCGVFQNDPDMIAGLFHEALTGKFARCFERVIFAVYTRKEEMIAPFKRRFQS